jgi:hypothetical protein
MNNSSWLGLGCENFDMTRTKQHTSHTLDNHLNYTNKKTKKGDWCNLEFVLGHGLITCFAQTCHFFSSYGKHYFFHYLII